MNRTALLLMSMTLLVGCAGARTTIVAPDTRFPVSLSEGMRAPDGHLLEPAEMEVVGTFESKRTIWGMLYSIIPLTPTTDLSKEVDQQVEAAGGQAIVRLKTEAQHCAFNHFIVFSFIPVWPGCSNIVVSGDIIRYRPAVVTVPTPTQAPTAPVPAAPPAVPPVTPKIIKRSKGRTRSRLRSRRWT
ncbi:MAG: hypothetical protein QM817_38560 [Archangium sp.]